MRGLLLLNDSLFTTVIISQAYTESAAATEMFSDKQEGK